MGSPGGRDSGAPAGLAAPLGDPVTRAAATLVAEAAGAGGATAQYRPMEARLRWLRAQAAQDCQRAANMTAIASTCLWLFLTVGWLFGLAGLVEALGWTSSGMVVSVLPDWAQLTLTLVLCLLTPVLIAYVGVTMLSAGRLAGHTYVNCLRGLQHAGHGLLFTDEGVQQALRSLQGEHWTETLLSEGQATQFEHTLLQASENYPAARLLPGGTEAAIRSRLLARRWRQRRNFLFKLPFWAWLLAAVVPVIGPPLLVLGVSTFTFLGPSFIQSRARLLAFIDFYLDSPRRDVAALGPPPPPPAWWETALAAWREPWDVKLW
jgi:hypothetical protein